MVNKTESILKLISATFSWAEQVGALDPKVRLDSRVLVRPQACRSYGGRKNGQGYISVNWVGSVGLPLPEDEDQRNRALAVSVRAVRKTATQRQQVRGARDRALGFYTRMEYASICDDPEIGYQVAETWEEVIAGLVAHEMAHLINYCTHSADWRGRNHGLGWQNTYRRARLWLVPRALEICAVREPVSFGGFTSTG